MKQGRLASQPASSRGANPTFGPPDRTRHVRSTPARGVLRRADPGTAHRGDIPDKLYRRLRRHALAQHRSIAQEVTHVLFEVVEVPVPVSILALRGLGRGLPDQRLGQGQGVEDQPHTERSGRAQYRRASALERTFLRCALPEAAITR